MMNFDWYPGLLVKNFSEFSLLSKALMPSKSHRGLVELIESFLEHVLVIQSDLLGRSYRLRPPLSIVTAPW